MFAAFSDLHGEYESLSELLDLAKAEGRELLVHAGDLTDAEYSGLIAGAEQMSRICTLIQEAGMKMIYVLGNRDVAGGRLVSCPLDGDLSKADIEVDGFRFTASAERAADSIYVTHYLEPSQRESQVDARLVLYGHDHTPRVYLNYVGLGYLRGRNESDPDAARGGFFLIDVEDDELEISFHNMGGLVKSRCAIHRDQGAFYVPHSWQEACPMCRNDSKHRFNF